MLTIFTIPKPFLGHINIIQRNAIQSWLRLLPKPEIILFGNDDGVAEIAKELDILHIPDIEKTETGTPLLSSAFNLAKERAKSKVLFYSNADIILTDDLISIVSMVKNSNFLISGQRCDVDIKEEINFNNLDWKGKLREKIKRTGKLHGLAGMDYFVFPSQLLDMIKMPKFIVGRPGLDNWLIIDAVLSIYRS